ncbi:MAG TPA: hypothetical protein VK550_10940 [Polyangiaceae bacterium]|nr:hypothetical protein [Polyangiaceae bacterium]
MFPSAKPEFLQDACEERPLTDREFVQVAEAATELLLAGAGNDINRWSELLTGRGMPNDFRLSFLREAERRVTAGELHDKESFLWNALREPLHLAYLHSGADSSEEIEILVRLYDLVTPKDLVARFAWLFGPHPQIPEQFTNGWREQQERLVALQADALGVLLRQEDGVNLAQRLAAAVAAPISLGFLLGRLPLPNALEQDLLDGTSPKWRRIRPAFFVARATGHDQAWLTNYLSGLVHSARVDEATESALLLPRTPATWEAIEEAGADLSDAYWKSKEFGYPQNDADAERTVLQFMRVGSFTHALDVAGSYAKHISTATILRVLSDAAQASILQQADSMRGYHIEQLFQKLHHDSGVDDDTLLKLELAYLSWLTGPSSRMQTLRLFRALEEQPELFAQLVAMVYRPRTEGEADAARAADKDADPADEPSLERRRNGAQVASHVLRNWKGYPGRGFDDKERDTRLLAWSRRTLELTASANRAEVGETEVARVLARVSRGTDGIWPCEAARELLEERRQHFGDCLSIAKRNLRGMVSKALYEGGKQERAIAAALRADASKLRPNLRWSETTALLDRLATRYEEDAEAEDAEAKSEKREAGED